MGNHNFSPNPSFEVSVANTTFTGNTGTQQPVVQPGCGGFSARMVATGGSAMSASQTIAGLTVGQVYCASFYGKITVGNFKLGATINSVSSPGTVATTSYFGRAWVTFTATATSHTLAIASTTSNSSGDTAYIDRIMVTEGPLPGPYFDGSSPFASWNGTSGLSASTSTAFVTGDTTYAPTESEVILANGWNMNSLAFNIVAKTGRYAIPAVRGDNIVVPGERGQTFVPNKPVDMGQWTLTMWVLGCMPDGTVPIWAEQRRIFERNYAQLLQQVTPQAAPVTLHVWQADGSIRTATAVLDGATDPTLMMGGRRAEIALLFDVLPGVWADYLSYTTVGTAGSGWSNQALSLPQLAGGTAPIEDSIITVQGPITNPKITDPVTGTWVQYTGSLISTDTWVVDCGAWTSKKNGSSVLTSTSHFGHPRFVVIDPGSIGRVPSLTLTGTGTNTTTNLTVQAKRQHWYA